ncbi:hypothetical protein [Paraburkholderia solisilvae]|uniref:ACT domain-containing protein n=1 Tax=Paraburkholderia solisilvae TaxID=624376 RepID=A0A6J5ETX3_9BURK|nr:hypothetical protein [Paraburkholderia solisilvae]CAB3768881.1 hypothetical protein LMG29739_05412 [Paraburkholderia solisilvae]
MMHEPVATLERPVPRTFCPPARAPQSSTSFVTIDITVSGTSSSAGRRALHTALGANLRLYVMTIDKRHERITFRVEVMSRTVEQVIAALTGALDRATIGRVRTTAITRLQDA